MSRVCDAVGPLARLLLVPRKGEGKTQGGTVALLGLPVNLLRTTGKTYSMFGEGAGNSRGMIPRCMEEVFAQLDRKAKVQLEYAVFGAYTACRRPAPFFALDHGLTGCSICADEVW